MRQACCCLNKKCHHPGVRAKQASTSRVLTCSWDARTGLRERPEKFQLEPTPKFSLSQQRARSGNALLEERLKVGSYLFECELPNLRSLRSEVTYEHQCHVESSEAVVCRSSIQLSPSGCCIWEPHTCHSWAKARFARNEHDQKFLFNKENFHALLYVNGDDCQCL